jgi:serine protease
MSLRPSRALWRLGLAGASLGLASLAALIAVPVAASASSRSATDPYLPSNGHAYRHGAIPTEADQVKIKNWNAQHPSPQRASGTTGPETMYYTGGIGGAGAVTSTPRVYLVFWGTQWGTQASDGNGNITLSADHDNGAPYLQEMFKNLGTGNELWSGTMTQYCDGSLVSSGASTCPTGAPHVGYPSGNALAGVWYDSSAAAPSPSTQGQIASEAVAAAKHFGNATSSSNRYAQYVVLSAPGTDPDGFLTSNWCAWHDYTTSSVGNLAYTNMPYVMDEGAACGQGFVNAPGTLDGYSIVEGHEYTETLTDQFPSFGWLSRSGSEVGDECAWILPGSPGGAADVTMGTGSFSMQSTWSNDTYSCAIGHTVVTGSNGNTVTVTNPGTQSGKVGAVVSLQIQAGDSASGQTLTYSASGLPAGLSINSGSGLISGTPTTATTSSVTVTATDTTGAKGSASFSWSISPSGNTVTVTNPGSQNTPVNSGVSLQILAGDSAPGQSLTYAATGLPAGLTINPSTGVISGTTSNTANTYNVKVTATDTTGATGSASFSWTIRNRRHH